MEPTNPYPKRQNSPADPEGITKAPKSKTQLKAEARAREQQLLKKQAKPQKFQPLDAATLANLTSLPSQANHPSPQPINLNTSTEQQQTPNQQQVNPHPEQTHGHQTPNTAGHQTHTVHTNTPINTTNSKDASNASTTTDAATNDRHTTDLQRKHVFEVYDRIAEGFDVSRTYIWSPVKAFFDSMKLMPQSLVLDAGCGNCKHLAEYGANHIVIGVDISRNLLKLGKRNQYIKDSRNNSQYLQSNVGVLPFKENVFDFILCSAVIGHFPLHLQRVNVLKELARCLKPGGKILLTVWAKDGRMTTPFSDVLVPFSLENVAKSNVTAPDSKVVATEDQTARYYHMFSMEEFSNFLLEALPAFTSSDPIAIDNDNLIQILKKPQESPTENTSHKQN